MRSLLVVALVVLGSVSARAQSPLADLKRFAHSHHDANEFTRHEQSDGTCLTHAHTVVLTFEADGSLHCRLSALPAGYKLEIWILSYGDYVTVGDFGYRVSVRAGQTIPLASPSASFNPGPVGVVQTPAWWVVGGPDSPVPLGPYPYKRVAITITLDSVGLETTTVLDVEDRSTFSVGAMSI